MLKFFQEIQTYDKKMYFFHDPFFTGNELRYDS